MDMPAMILPSSHLFLHSLLSWDAVGKDREKILLLDNNNHNNGNDDGNNGTVYSDCPVEDGPEDC